VKHNRRWQDFDRKIPLRNFEIIVDPIMAFSADTCVWTRSNIDLGRVEKIYALACEKTAAFMAVPPHISGETHCHCCGRRIVEEFTI